MGIRGVTSILFDDRNRFGTPWALRKTDEKVRNVIYIDGPALLYHLLNFDVQVASSSDQKINEQIFHGDMFPSLIFGTTSPETLHNRAYTFAKNLLLAGAHEIHLVVEGLAPKEKLCHQLERIGKNGVLCDSAAKEKTGYRARRISACNVPHIFSEISITRAFIDISNESEETGSVFVKYSKGEAENYIAERMRAENAPRSHLHENIPSETNIFVLSNDSDFLVYESSSGFIPLSSLEFLYHNHTGIHNNEIMVKGWQFLRSKFLNAMNIRSYQMPVVAALAGCDYEPSSMQLKKRLSLSRQNIVVSKIGGLRSKKQKQPTAKSVLIAVTRFIAHCNNIVETRIKKEKRIHICGDTCSSFKVGQADFFKVFVSEVVGNGKGKELRQDELIQAIELVSSSYSLNLSNVCDDEKKFPAFLRLDIRRIIVQETFLCKPVVEVYINNSNAKKSKGQISIWSNTYLMEVRKRLYTVLSYSILSPSSILKHSLVIREFFPCTDNARKVMVDENMHLVETEGTSSSPCDLLNLSENMGDKFLHYCLVSEKMVKLDPRSNIFQNILASIAPKWYPMFISGCMLLYQIEESSPLKKTAIKSTTYKELFGAGTSDFLLFSLVSTFPPTWKISSQNFNSLFRSVETNKGGLFSIMSRTQITCYHASLLLDLLCSKKKKLKFLPWHIIFRDTVFFVCHHLFLVGDCENGNEGYKLCEPRHDFRSMWKNFRLEVGDKPNNVPPSFSHDLGCILREVLRRKLIDMNEIQGDLEETLNEWKYSILAMWSAWVKILKI